ncbi:MAG: polyphosphate polymerase domain-containing protein [Bacteroidales bacterium]
MSEDQKLTAITSRFPTFTLNEDLFLFDRRDSKYLFLTEDLYKILHLLHNHYNILKINCKNYSHYRTTYFDTRDYDLYKAHHNGKLNRYKVRVRNYLDSKMIYLEVKFKSNKRRTIKKRILTEDIDQLSGEDYLFLKTAIPYDPHSLFPSLMTEYIRLTLLNYEHQEKVTIDFDLNFRHLKNDKEVSIPKIGIIEIKNERGRNHSLLSRILSDDLIHYQRVSKYCLGMSMLDSTIKKNLYKPKLLFIDHM